MMINTGAPAATANNDQNEVAGAEKKNDEEGYEQEALNYLSLAL